MVKYKELPPDAFKPHDTYVIGFCPDTDSFFVTNQRGFFWETLSEFKNENDGVKFFEENMLYFLNVKNRIMSEIVFGYRDNGGVYLENTGKWYC